MCACFWSAEHYFVLAVLMCIIFLSPCLSISWFYDLEIWLVWTNFLTLSRFPKCTSSLRACDLIYFEPNGYTEKKEAGNISQSFKTPMILKMFKIIYGSSNVMGKSSFRNSFQFHSIHSQMIAQSSPTGAILTVMPQTLIAKAFC